MRFLTLTIFLFVAGRAQANAASERDYNLQLDGFSACLQWSAISLQKLISRDLESPSYAHLNRQWNLRKEIVYPLAYFLPTSAGDVAGAVKCGLKAQLRLIPNSGGHSYEAISWGNNSTIIVDFRNMKQIQIVGSGRNAVGEVQPGALVGPINAYFWTNGGYAVPMGNCLTVGIGGHAIGGGVGFFSAMYGLTIDNLLEVEMVDGTGNLVRASRTVNPDLFWALRGVGPGYIGIVTKFTLRLFQASENKYTLVNKLYSVKQFASVYVAFQNMQNWINEKEPEVVVGIWLASDTYNGTYPPLSPGILVSIHHIQDPVNHPNGNASLLEAISTIFPPAVETHDLFLNYIQLVSFTGYAPVIFPNTSTAIDGANVRNNRQLPQIPPEPQILAMFNSLTKDIAAPRYFKAKSFFIKKQFTLEEMTGVQKVIARIPQNNIWILINTEGGAVQRVAGNETAYSHRNDLVDLTIHYEGSPLAEDVAEGMDYLKELWETIQFMDGGETYQNYPDLDIIDHLERNYDGNLDRLIREKRKWDPRNYFVSPLSLPVVTRSDV